MTSLRMLHRSLPPLASLLALLVAGCPGDDGSSMDTEQATEGSSGTTGSVDPTGTTDPDPSTSSADTTEGPDSTGADTSTGEPPAEGVCFGLDQVGNLATVFAREGGQIGGAQCDPDPMPCGGDVVGTWTIENVCGFDALPNPLEMQCPGSSFVFEVLDQTGSITFEDDGSFVQEFDIQLQATLTLDTMACFMADCATFEMGLQMEDPAVTCQEVMMGMCECVFPPEPGGRMVMGTYEVMGDTLALEVDGETEELAFCIAGDRLDTWQGLFTFTETETMCADATDCEAELADMHEAYECIDPAMG